MDMTSLQDGELLKARLGLWPIIILLLPVECWTFSKYPANNSDINLYYLCCPVRLHVSMLIILCIYYYYYYQYYL